MRPGKRAERRSSTREDTSGAIPVDFAGCQVSVREEAARGCCKAILQHLHEGRVRHRR